MTEKRAERLVGSTRRDELVRLTEEVQRNRTLRRSLCFQEWHRKLSDQIDSIDKNADLDPRIEAIIRIQNLGVKLALGKDLHTESDMANAIAKLREYFRGRHVQSNQYLYGDAVSMIDHPLKDGRNEKPLWRQIKEDVGMLQIKSADYYIKNFIDPEYKG